MYYVARYMLAVKTLAVACSVCKVHISLTLKVVSQSIVHFKVKLTCSLHVEIAAVLRQPVLSSCSELCRVQFT